MGAISTSNPLSDHPEVFEAEDFGSSSFGDRSAAPVWLARAVIVGVAGLLAWYTWGRWGDFQVDSGRELYIPAEILKGKLLFRDLWYMYGPLAAYVNALLFWIFGVHLTVLYVCGLTLAIGTALITFEIARRFRLGLVGSALPALFLLVESFYPTIRNFVFPYSYAAALGAFLGTACLLFVMRHASSNRISDLAIASALSGLAVLTKQEIGLACLALLSVEIAAGYLCRRSLGALARDLGVFFAGHVPAVVGYGWFIWKVSARVLFVENWIQTPGTYFMRTFSKITLPDQGLRFVPSELLQATEYTILGIALWALIACFVVAASKKGGGQSHWWAMGAMIGCLSPVAWAAREFVHMFPWGFAINPNQLASLVVIPLTQVIAPKGIFFLVLVFTIDSIWKWIRQPSPGMALQSAGLGIYAALVSVRQMLELVPSPYKCAVFFNGPAFLIFVILLYRIVRWASRSLDPERRDFVVRSLLTAEAVLLFLMFFPTHQLLTTKFSTEYGSFYTSSDVAELFPQIISFMKTHTRNGKDILMLPEPPSLYVFAGMEAPSRWYSLVPGYVAPEQEQDFINDVAASKVRYVLISNRNMVEYGIQGFANGGYNPGIYKWIMANYVKVGQFGPTPEPPGLPYIVWVFEKQDLQQEN